MRHPGENVPAERVRPERVLRRRGSQPGEGVQGERVTRQAETDDGGEQPAVQQGQGAGHGRPGPVQGVQSTVTQGGPDQQPGREPGEDAGGGREQNQGERAGLQDGQILGERGVQSEPAEARDVEDLLDGDRSAGQTDHEQSQVGQQSGHATAHRLTCHGLRRNATCRGGQRPRFGERAGQQVVQQPPDQCPGGQTEGQRGQYHPLRPVPAQGGQPAQLHADHRGQHRGDEELGQGRQHGRRRAAGTASAESSPRSEAERTGAHR